DGFAWDFIATAPADCVETSVDAVYTCWALPERREYLDSVEAPQCGNNVLQGVDEIAFQARHNRDAKLWSPRERRQMR
ncbi:hypothetical protein, partial [Escherichia coli]|uniref:hypothetical protein n=1 Tax=Escherichia coli TaxID=562 RepID=UPI000D466DD5